MKLLINKKIGSRRFRVATESAKYFGICLYFGGFLVPSTVIFILNSRPQPVEVKKSAFLFHGFATKIKKEKKGSFCTSANNVPFLSLLDS